MKNIVSYNMEIRDLSLAKLVDFYFICERSHNALYLYQNEKARRIHRMTELILYILTSKEEKILIIVEGHKAPVTMGRLIECVYGSKAYVKEA